MKQLLFFNLLMVYAFTSHAQNIESHSVNKYRIESGYQNFRTFDLNTSPLLFRANNGIISFQFDKEKPGINWNIATFIAIGGNQSKRFGVRTGLVMDPYLINGTRDTILYVINPAISFINQSLKYSYNWKLDTRREMSIGASIHNNFLYGGMGADSWFVNQMSLLPSYNINILTKNKHRINADVSLALFSFIVRQPYTRRPSLPIANSLKAHLKTGSSIALLDSFQQLNFHVKYDFQLSADKNIGVSYYFMWMRYTNIPDRNLGAYSNSILISYTLCKK